MSEFLRRAVLGLLCSALVVLPVTVQALTEEPLTLRYRSWAVGPTSNGRTDMLRGLPQVSARAIAKGSDGFIWVGTWNGLARFDGLDFDVFHSGNTPAMTGNFIDQLYVDDEGSLWVTTGDGVLRVKNQVFQRIHQAEQGFRSAGFAETADGSLWLGGDQLWRIDGDVLITVAFAGDVIDALEAVGNDLWVLDANGDLFRYRDGEAEHLDAAAWRGLRIVAIDEFQGALHITTTEGVFRLDRAGDDWRAKEWQAPGGTALVATATSDDYFFVITDEGYLYQLSAGTQPNASASHELQTPIWRAVAMPTPVSLNRDAMPTFVDSGPSIWIGTTSGGLHNFWAAGMRREAQSESISRARVWSFFVDEGVYAATDDGLYRRNGDGSWVLEVSAETLNGAVAYSYWQGAAGQYLGTRSGLFWRSGSSGSYTKVAALGNRQINSLVDLGGKLWLATERGLFWVDALSREIKEVAGTTDASVRAIWLDGEQGLWVGTQTGLLRFDANGDPLSVDEKLRTSFITAILELEPGWVALATYGQGLFIRNPGGEWRQYDTDDGLPFQDFFSLTLSENWLWASAGSGVVRFERNALLNEQVLADVLLRDDGVGGESGRVRCCNGAGHGRSVRIDDRLFLATNEGVVSMAMDRPISSSEAPVVGPVWYANKRLPSQAVYTLPPEQRDLEISFAAPHFATENLPQFRYRLVPTHDDWIDVRDRKIAYFTNLEAGVATFELQSRVGVTDWQSATPITLRVEPYFYETWYAKALAALSLVAVFGIYMRLRTNQLRHRAIALERAVAARTAEVEAANQATLEIARDSQRLVREANAPIVTVSRDGTVLDWNRSAERLTGWQANEVLGRKIDEVLLGANPPVDVTKLFREPSDDGTIDGMRLAFKNRGGRLITLLLGGTRLPPLGSTPERLVMVGQDLTDYLEREQELIQASKMSTLGEMATGMAHELNQPLNVIKLIASNLTRNLGRKPDFLEILPSKLERINEQVDRAARIIDHLRLYGRRSGTPGYDDLVVFNPLVPVQDAITLFREQLALENIYLEAEFAEGDLSVKGDPLLLEQVMINVIGNARDAIREHTRADEPRRICVRSRVNAGKLVIDVEDTGGGASDDALTSMFQPFFTTKEPGKGTGLGLSISYTSVRNMSGEIFAENLEPGLRITITLPLHAAESAA